MNKQLKEDLDNIESLLNSAIDEGLNYLKNIEQIPTSVILKDLESIDLKDSGKGGLGALDEFKNRFRNLMVASAGPRYWGFVTGGTTPAAIVGDILATIYDQNTQTTKGHGDISAHVEFETVKLLLELFELPADFLGGFVTGATMSNFTCLGVARQWIGAELGFDVAKNGMPHSFNILAAVPHSSSIKALSMLGLGSNNIRLIKTIDPTREAIDVAALEKEIQSLNNQPFVLISSGGTVNTVDFDDFSAIAELKKKYNFWWHIDAAFGGFASLSKQHSHLVKGWENADSITIDGHK